MTKKQLITVSIISTIVVSLTHVLFIDFLSENVLKGIASIFFKPTLNWTLALIAAGGVTLLLSEKMFGVWKKYFFYWYLPLAYLLTFTFPVYGGIMTMTRDIASIFFGIGLVMITAVFVMLDMIKKYRK